MRKDNRNSKIFEWFLIVTAIIILCSGGYESYMQRYRPDYSILNYLHRYSLLKEYPVIYEPGKGIWHHLGWAGSGMMVIMMLYSVRKRVTLFRSMGSLSQWLSAHMFLGVMGPILITFHTTFKFGGIIATSFWSMILTMIFGILGRYIYVQIPRTLAGTELAVRDIEQLIETIDRQLGEYSGGINVSDLSKVIGSVEENSEDNSLLRALFVMLWSDIVISYQTHQLNKILKNQYHFAWKVRRRIDFLLKKKAAFIRRKNYLSTSQKLLHYWHVVHIPLAIVMFLIMILHIVVYYLFRSAYSI